MTRFVPAGLSLAALLLTSAASAEEGMWMPHQTSELAERLTEAGLELDPAALSNFRAAPLNAIVSLGGCSAAFVSPEGLVATNHHCVAGSIQYNSAPDRDYLTDGFLARTRGDEVQAAPGSRVFVIEDLRDVTRQMNQGVTARLSGLDRQRRLEANRNRLIGECERQANRRCDVRAYYGGAQYWLQQQLEIRDVRLVYAPAEGIGNFGGETDNWQWPRHTGDFGFYRAYVAPDGSSATYSPDNVPYRPRAWLPIAQQGVSEGDFIMLAGFPGTTDRLRTAAEASFYYANYYPLQQRLLADYSDLIGRLTDSEGDARIRYASIRAGADNYKKKLLGQMAGAERVRLSERKSEQEQAYRAWLQADPQRQRQYGEAAAELDRLVSESNGAALTDLRTDLLNRAQLLGAARLLYRWAQERAKPDSEREPGYQDRDRQLVTERLRRIERRFLPQVDRGLFEAALAEYRQLPDESRNAAFEAKLAEIGLDRLYSQTQLGQTDTRLAWLDRPAHLSGCQWQPEIHLWPGDRTAAGRPDLDPVHDRRGDGRQAHRHRRVRRARPGDRGGARPRLWPLRLARAGHPAGRLSVDRRHHQRQFRIGDPECPRRARRTGLRRHSRWRHLRLVLRAVGQPDDPCRQPLHAVGDGQGRQCPAPARGNGGAPLVALTRGAECGGLMPKRTLADSLSRTGTRRRRS